MIAPYTTASRVRIVITMAALALVGGLIALPAVATPGVPPDITAIESADTDIDPDETRKLDVTVTGYDTGGTWSFSGSGLTATVARSRNELVRLDVTATASAAFGARSLTVVNPDGLSDTFPDAITVTGTGPPPATGDITGHVFEDVDGDGDLDVGEPGFAAVSVGATDVTGATFASTTDTAGDFAVYELATGQATVTVTAPPGYSLTTGNGEQLVNVVEGSVVAAPIGFTEATLTDVPNFVVIVTDDQRWDTIGRCTPMIDALDLDAGADACMPELQEHLTSSGVTFLKGEVTQSLCCPSRASILSGQYSTTHGVTNLQGSLFDDSSTLATWLDSAGYRTGLFGKYLNGYGEGVLANYIPPGWNSFHGFHGHGIEGAENPYTDYPWIDWDAGDVSPIISTFRVDESTSTEACTAGNNYSTDRMCVQAREFIAADATAPFFAYVGTAAPHTPNTPPDRYASTFSNVAFSFTPDFDVIPSPNPPSYLSTVPLGDRALSKAASKLRPSLQTMLAVDDLIGALGDQLAADGRLANTVWIFISDNGAALGEHRLFGKQCEYWICHRVPFVVACPEAVCTGVQPGSVDGGNYVLNIDIAPTIADLAGVTPGLAVDGQSMVPILEDPAAPWRTEWFLHENGPLLDGIVAEASDGDTYKYVELATDETELFNLINDEYEIVNLAGDPAHASIEADLADRLSAHLGS